MAVAGTNIGTGWITISAEMSGLSREIQQKMGGVESDMGKRGKKTGNVFATALGTAIGFVGGKVMMGAGAAVGAVFTQGLDRYMKIENAEKKLQALGNSTDDVKRIMQGATAAVKGTAFGLGAAADTAASAVASGIKPGAQLDQVLKTIANTAAIAGVDMSEMGAIFNKVSAGGKIQGEELAQLGDRGVPVLQWLSKELGVTVEQVRKMASEGKIDFATFERAMRNGMDPEAAKMMGDTLSGSWKNAQAAIGRFGGEILKVVGPGAKRVLDGAIKGIDTLSSGVKNLVSVFSGGEGGDRPQWLLDLIEKIRPAVEGVKGSLGRLKQVFGDIFGDISARVREFAEERGPQLKHIWETITSTWTEQLGNAKRTTEGVITVVRWLWDMFGDQYLAVVTGAWGIIIDAIQAVVGIFNGVVTWLRGILTGDWTAIWSGYTKVVSSFWDGVENILWTAIESIAKVFGVDEGTLANMKAKWDGFWNAIRDRMKVVSDWWAETGQAAWDTMARWFTDYVLPVLKFFVDGTVIMWDLAKKAFRAVTDWWHEPGTGGRAIWDSLVDRFKTFIAPYLDELKAQLGTTWDEIKKSFKVVTDWWHEPGTGGRAIWDNLVAMYRDNVAPTIDSLRQMWTVAWKAILDAAVPITDWWSRPGNGGKKMGDELLQWAPLMEFAFKFLAAMIVGPVIAAFKALEFGLKGVEFAAVVFRSAWSAMERGIIDPIRAGVNTAIDILNALIKAYNVIALKVSVDPIPTLSRFGSQNSSAPTAGRGRVPQFDTGGWTGPGSKYQVAGVVHADEFVINKAARGSFESKFPGYLKHINDTGTLPGYAAGGRVHPVPGYGVNWRRGYHGVDRGLDIPAPTGAPVLAMRDSMVTSTARWNRSYGWHIRTSDGAVYAHLSGINVNSGQRVAAGQLIGRVGSTGNSTGPHLHVTAYDGRSAVGQALGGAFGAVQQAVDFVAQLKDAIAGPMGRLSELGSSPFGEMLKKLPRLLASGMTSKVKGMFDTGTGIDGYWRGTSHANSGWHWVGERGPELINLKGGERIMSSSKSKDAALGGRNITYAPVLVNEDPDRQYEDFAWRLAHEAGL